MPDVPQGGSSPAAQLRRFAWPGAGRGGVFGLMLFALLLILGGAEALGLGVVRQQDAARLAAAPVCTDSEQTGCRLDVQVTVIDIATDAGRSEYATKLVKVQTPDGRTPTVYAGEHDFGLLSRLYVNKQVQAELWNGSVIRLDDGAGHYLLADDSPVVTSVLFPIIGLGSVGAGGLLLALCVRALRRQRATSR